MIERDDKTVAIKTYDPQWEFCDDCKKSFDLGSSENQREVAYALPKMW